MMQKLTLLLLCLSVANGNPAAGKPWHWKSRTRVLSADGSFNASARIVGGSEAEPHSWPHQVGLFIDGFFCAGSLISNEWILSSALCVDGASSIEAVMGAHNIQESEPTQVKMYPTHYVVHENWNYDTLDYDLAVVKLPEPVTFNENIKSVKLPSSDLSGGEAVTVTGWGSVSPDSTYITDRLKQMETVVISHDECADVYGSFIDEEIICTSTTGGKGTCAGDNGGPMNKDGKVYGVVSFQERGGCAKGYPDGYTRVYKFLDWIEQKTGVTP